MEISFKKNYYADVIFTLKEELFYVNKSVLARHSSIFNSMFSSEFQEGKNKIVTVSLDHLHLLTSEILEIILNILYGLLDEFDDKYYWGIYQFNDMYNCPQLQDMLNNSEYEDLNTLDDVKNAHLFHHEKYMTFVEQYVKKNHKMDQSIIDEISDLSDGLKYSQITKDLLLHTILKKPLSTIYTNMENKGTDEKNTSLAYINKIKVYYNSKSPVITLADDGKTLIVGDDKTTVGMFQVGIGSINCEKFKKHSIQDISKIELKVDDCDLMELYPWTTSIEFDLHFTFTNGRNITVSF